MTPGIWCSAASGLLVEIDEPGPVSIVKHRECTSYLKPPSRRFPPARLIVDQHRACLDFDRRRYGLTFTEVELGRRDCLFRA